VLHIVVSRWPLFKNVVLLQFQSGILLSAVQLGFLMCLLVMGEGRKKEMEKLFDLWLTVKWRLAWLHTVKPWCSNVKRGFSEEGAAVTISKWGTCYSCFTISSEQCTSRSVPGMGSSSCGHVVLLAPITARPVSRKRQILLSLPP